MIQYAENQHCLVLMEMWKLCFPSDSDEFIAFYFNHVYRADETLVLLEGGIPVASLQMIPYQIKTGRITHDAGYISGAMTHPAFRRHGYMEQLLLAAFDEMKKKGFSVSFLIPQEEWLFEFYQKYDYRKAFPVNLPEAFIRFQLPPEETGRVSSEYPVNIYTRFSETEAVHLYSIYSRFLSKKENVVLKNQRQFSNILQDFFIDQGILFAGEQGIAFTFPGKEKKFLKEFFYTDTQSQEYLLDFIANHFLTNELLISIPGTTSHSHFSGMVKTLDTTITLPDDIYMSMMLE